MSNEALAWAWTVPCAPTAKLVLVALADRANEAGECFPSVRDMMERTCLKERAIQYALQDLERAGWVRRDFRSGRASNYVVNVGAQTPARDAPVHEMHPRTTCTGGVHHMHQGGAPDAGEGCTTCTHNPHITLIEPTPNPQRDAPALGEPLTLTPEPKAKREANGHRLPADWHPSVELEGFAVGLGLNADAVAAQFRDYWHAAPGAKGRKADWAATWRNWCRREAERPKPKLHTLPLAEQDRRILAAVGLGFNDPPPIVQPLRRIAQ